MTAMFDTLKFARALREGGQFTPDQAERLSDALSDAVAGEVVSRADLGATEAKLVRQIDDLDGKLNRRIDDLEGKLDRRIDDLEGKLDRRIDDLEDKVDRRIDDLEGKLDHGLKEVRSDLRTEIKGVQAEIKGVEAKIEAAKADTLKWIVGIIGFQSVAIIGAAIVLARILAH